MTQTLDHFTTSKKNTTLYGIPRMLCMLFIYYLCMLHFEFLTCAHFCNNNTNIWTLKSYTVQSEDNVECKRRKTNPQ